MTWLYIMVCIAYLAVISIAALLVWSGVNAARHVRRWYIARRNERQLKTHMQARRGFKALKRGRYVYPEKWL